MELYYFAYGSNLNIYALQRFFIGKGYDPETVRPLFTAYLPDRELCFNFHSPSWGGGVLNVVTRRGSITPGAVFAVEGLARVALDCKEGCPHFYRTFITTSLLPDSSKCRVFSYEVVPRHQQPVKPSWEYVEVVRAGLRGFSIDDAHLESALRGKSYPLKHIFVYGTLQQGECREHLVKERLEEPVKQGRVRGRLIDLGGYPGLIPATSTDQWVYGELLTVSDIEDTLSELDIVEGFVGYGSENLYDRVLSTVETPEGRYLAWVYIYSSPPDLLRLIPSGNWKRRSV